MGEQTVECTRPDCDTDIPLVKENLIILRPEVPLLSAQCPECGKTRVLTKDISIELGQKYFKDLLADSLESLGVVTENDECEGPLMPSKDISKMVKETLELLGYKGKAWGPKVKAIVEFVKSSATYQNPQGLHQLLAAWKVDSQHIPMIVTKVFGSQENPQYNFAPNMGSGPMPNYTGLAPGAQPTPVGAGYSMTQTPQGQVIIIPPVTPPATKQEREQESDDTVIIEEKVGKNGEVISRVIKQKAPAQASAPQAPQVEQKSSVDELNATLTLLKGFGVIGNEPRQEPPPPAVSPEIAKTLDKISNVLATLSNTQSPARDRDDRESEAARQYKTELKELNDEIKQMRDEQHNAEMAALRSEIGTMRSTINNVSPHGLNDFQFGIDSKQKNLQTLTQAVESAGAKLVEPLVAMQTMQSKLSGLMAIRQLEAEDRVAPGTYMGALTPKQDVPDDEVSNTLQTWRERAGVSKSDGDVE